MHILERQKQLQEMSASLLKDTPLLSLLQRLGKPIQTGSSVTGLMVYHDIDFAVHAESPNVQDGINLTQEIFDTLAATALKIADFGTDDSKRTSYYVGIEMPYGGEAWKIDATVTAPGPIATSPPEMESWLNAMTKEQRLTILTLKKELIDAGRYIGSKSVPPYTFRSRHLYEAVLKGDAKDISGLERYFKS